MINLAFIDIKNSTECSEKVIKLYNEAFPKEEYEDYMIIVVRFGNT